MRANISELSSIDEASRTSSDEMEARLPNENIAAKGTAEGDTSRSSSESSSYVSSESSYTSGFSSSPDSEGSIDSDEISEYSDDEQSVSLEEARRQQDARDREARQPGPDAGMYNHSEIGNLPQYLAMKEFHGHNISDEMLDHFMRAQGVIDKTRDELGHPANITATNGEQSNGEISFGELIESNADMAVVKHLRDKLLPNKNNNSAQDALDRAALATIYEQGNCTENASKGTVNATKEFVDDPTMSIRRKGGKESDHGWAATTFTVNEPREGKDYQDQDIKGDEDKGEKSKKGPIREKTIIDSWSDLQVPIFQEDMHENYQNSKTTAKFKHKKQNVVDKYDKLEGIQRGRNPEAMQEKAELLEEVTPQYREGLNITDAQLSQGIYQLDAGVDPKDLEGQDLDDYKKRNFNRNKMQEGLYQPGGTHIISKEFDDKTLANEIYASQKFEKNQQGPFSEQAQSTREERITADDYIERGNQPPGANMRDHFDLMHQVRATGISKRMSKSTDDSIKDANTTFSARIQQEGQDRNR